MLCGHLKLRKLQPEEAFRGGCLCRLLVGNLKALKKSNLKEHSRQLLVLVACGQPEGTKKEQPKGALKMTTDTDNTVRIFEASRGRKIILITVFTLLVPFFISLPFMIFLRLSKGFYYDAAILFLFAILFAIWMVFLGAHILSSLRTRIQLNEQDAVLLVPNWRGPLPLLPYKTISLTYENVKSVESRSEIYREAIIPVLMRSCSIVTQDGERHILGYTKEKATDPAFPFSEISHEIALRAGLPLSERGTIHAGGQYLAAIKGPPSWDKRPLSPAAVQTARKAAQKFWWIIIAISAAVLVTGVGIEFWRLGVEGFAQ